MAYALSVCGGSVITDTMGLVKCDLAIDSGKIVGMFRPGDQIDAAETIDARHLVVFPGVIDPHVHFGLGAPEDWTTESRSAAIGGVTMVLNYIQKADSYLDVAPQERLRAEAESVIDFGLHLILMNDVHLAEVGRYVTELGIPSFKYFTNFKGEEGAYLGIEGTDNGFFLALCQEVSKYGSAVLAVHTENIEVVWRLAAELKASGRDGLAAWTESRPDIVETHDMLSAFFFAEHTGAQLYIPHLSSALGLKAYREHHARGGRTYIETCPHYLTHTCASELGGLVKVNPPVRMPSDVEALWSGLFDGSIAVVGSDHNSRLRARKEGSIWKASAGFPGVATLLPVLLSEGHHKRGLPLEQVAKITSSNAARIFGLYPRKGAISIGSDADLTLVDVNKEVNIDSSKLGSHADYSIYEGWRLTGWPVGTMVRGKLVMRDGEILVDPGYGQFVGRPVTTPALATVG